MDIFGSAMSGWQILFEFLLPFFIFCAAAWHSTFQRRNNSYSYHTWVSGDLRRRVELASHDDVYRLLVRALKVAFEVDVVAFVIDRVLVHFEWGYIPFLEGLTAWCICGLIGCLVGLVGGNLYATSKLLDMAR